MQTSIEEAPQVKKPDVSPSQPEFPVLFLEKVLEEDKSGGTCKDK